jgi:hypothetical protein
MVAGLAGCASANPAGNPGGSGDSSESPVTTTDPMAEEPLGSPGVACVDWIFFETPLEAAVDAGAVVRGTVVEQDGTGQVFGVDANRWLVDVEEVLDRFPGAEKTVVQPGIAVSPGDRIAVISTPETCGGGLYPGGDPLDPATGLGGDDGSVIVLLSAADLSEEPEEIEPGETPEAPSSTDDLHLITPYQGVLTPTADGGLPKEWPAP